MTSRTVYIGMSKFKSASEKFKIPQKSLIQAFSNAFKQFEKRKSLNAVIIASKLLIKVQFSLPLSRTYIPN